MRDSVRDLAESLADSSHCSLLLYQACQFIAEVYQVGKAMLATPEEFLVLHVPGNAFQDELLHQFPRVRGKADEPVALCVLLAHLEDRNDSMCGGHALTFFSFKMLGCVV